MKRFFTALSILLLLLLINSIVFAQKLPDMGGGGSRFSACDGARGNVERQRCLCEVYGACYLTSVGGGNSGNSMDLLMQNYRLTKQLNQTNNQLTACRNTLKKVSETAVQDFCKKLGYGSSCEVPPYSALPLNMREAEKQKGPRLFLPFRF